MKLASPLSVYTDVTPNARSGGLFGSSKKDESFWADIEKRSEKRRKEWDAREAENDRRLDRLYKESQERLDKIGENRLQDDKRIIESTEKAINGVLNIGKGLLAVGVIASFVKLALVGVGIYATYKVVNQKVNGQPSKPVVPNAPPPVPTMYPQPVLNTFQQAHPWPPQQ